MTKASADNTFSVQDKVALGLTPDVAGTTDSKTASVVGCAVPTPRRDAEPPRVAGAEVGGALPCGGGESPRATDNVGSDAVSHQNGESPHLADDDVVGVTVSLGNRESAPGAANIAEGGEVGSMVSSRSVSAEGRSGDVTAVGLDKARVTSVEFAETILGGQEEAVVAAEAGEGASSTLSQTP